MIRHCRRIKKCVYSILSVILSVTAVTLSFYVGEMLLKTAKRHMYPIKYSEYVTYYSRLYGVPESVSYSVIFTESGFRANAVSRAGACGLMQLMPETYASVAEKLGRVPDRLLIFEPAVNIDCGIKLLSLLYSKYGNWDTVYAAYNAGEARVDTWLNDGRYSKNGRLYNIPFKETSEYVTKVSNAVNEYRKIYKI